MTIKIRKAAPTGLTLPHLRARGPTPREEEPRAIALNFEVSRSGTDEMRDTISGDNRETDNSTRDSATEDPCDDIPTINSQCLPRGGTYISTMIGPIQVGMPPETIKDSMALGLPVPQYFVVPPETFCRTLGTSLGANVAEFEFPAYYNFFLKGQTLKLIVDSMDAEERIRALMQETLLGPEKIDTSIDFDPCIPVGCRPDLKKELSYFRVFNGKELSVDLLITFIHVNNEGFVIIKGEEGTKGADWCVTISGSDSGGGEYIITEHQRDTKLCDGARQSFEGIAKNEPDGASDGSESPRGDADENLGRMGGESASACNENPPKSGGQDDERRQEAESTGSEVGRGGDVRLVDEPSLPEDEEDDRRHAESSDSDLMKSRSTNQRGTRVSGESMCTPTRPGEKFSTVQSSGGQTAIASPVTRFARWIIQRAHVGERKQDHECDEDRDSPLPSRGMNNRNNWNDNGISAAGGDEFPPRRLSGMGRTRPVLIKGFKARRTVPVGMTCLLPNKLATLSDQTEDEFDSPMFGVTVLGNSHGFDPKGNTSGYVLWINKRGYMVDPPPYASSILQAFNIRPSLIAGVIVTHCHADHDAGTFQKVFLDEQVNIISTRTIYESFIRKYTALSGMRAALIRSSHKFTPVTIGQSLRLDGASFDFFYTLHSIPCVGFEVTFRNKSLVFSADHMNDPDRIRAMCEEGFLSEGRRDSLLHFPWHHNLIFHEAGIPPIHTPMQTLQNLPDEVKKRLFVVHVSESSIPPDSGLQVAPAGVDKTIRLEMEPHQHCKAIKCLELLLSVGILSGISAAQARSMLEVGKKVKYEANTMLQHCNRETVAFVIICSGQAVATIPNEDGGRPFFGNTSTVLRRGDCYGEELLLSGSVRRRGNMDVKAATNIEILTFDGQDLEHIFGLKTKTLDNTFRLDRLLMYNSVLSMMTRKQMLQLETFTKVKKIAAGEVVWEAGEAVNRVVIVADGKLQYVSSGKRELISGCYPRDGRKWEGGERPRLAYCPSVFLPGSMVGRAGSTLDPPAINHYRYTLQAVVDSVVLTISRDDMATFSYSNPGVFMAIHDLHFVC